MRPGEEVALFLDREKMGEKLVRAGINRAIAPAKAALFHQCAAALEARGIRCGIHAWHVPGRVEVLGKHTDYAGGRSLLIATEQGFCVMASRRDDNRVRLIDVAAAESVEFAMDPQLIPTSGAWSNYPMTVARRVARNFPGQLRGVDLAFVSDLPRAAGMSSSSAFVIGTFLALSWMNNLAVREEYRANIHSPEELAAYIATNENGQSFGPLSGDKGVGTFGGSEDHTAILCSEAGKLKQYSFCPVRHERTIEMPKGWVFAIAVSGIVAQKTGAAMDQYNDASRRASAVAEAWRAGTSRNDPQMAAAIHSAPDAISRIRQVIAKSAHGGFSSQSLLDRLNQFYEESEQIIPRVGDLLDRGEVRAIGTMVDRSQELSEKLLGNQVAETVFLARVAREAGAACASAFGAGFGGSVWALVEQTRAEELIQSWKSRYAAAYPEAAANASFITTGAGAAACEV